MKTTMLYSLIMNTTRVEPPKHFYWDCWPWMYGLGWEGRQLPSMCSQPPGGRQRLPTRPTPAPTLHPCPGSGSPQTRLDEDLAWAGRSFLSCASSERACCGEHRCPGQERSLREKALPCGGCDRVWSCWSVSHSPRLLAHLPQIRKSPSLSDTEVTISDVHSGINIFWPSCAWFLQLLRWLRIQKGRMMVFGGYWYPSTIVFSALWVTLETYGRCLNISCYVFQGWGGGQGWCLLIHLSHRCKAGKTGTWGGCF